MHYVLEEKASTVPVHLLEMLTRRKELLWFLSQYPKDSIVNIIFPACALPFLVSFKFIENKIPHGMAFLRFVWNVAAFVILVL